MMEINLCSAIKSQSIVTFHQIQIRCVCTVVISSLKLRLSPVTSRWAHFKNEKMFFFLLPQKKYPINRRYAMHILMLSVWWWLSLLWTLPLREIICWRIKISFHCFFFAINFRQQQQHIVVSEESKWKKKQQIFIIYAKNNNRERCCAGLLNINVTLMSLRETFVMRNRHAMMKKFFAEFEWIRKFSAEKDWKEETNNAEDHWH